MFKNKAIAHLNDFGTKHAGIIGLATFVILTCQVVYSLLQDFFNTPLEVRLVNEHPPVLRYEELVNGEIDCRYFLNEKISIANNTASSVSPAYILIESKESSFQFRSKIDIKKLFAAGEAISDNLGIIEVIPGKCKKTGRVKMRLAVLDHKSKPIGEVSFKTEILPLK